ncbi:Zinc finger protein with KRAB and SCAN domains 1 [Saguinus oedipus]|uniref:Zinc finger protein with KRAB and SCAN domains 1 n=1 Tax=Saguinus oedipus TaxID=9490 RepID=A0ABQ9W6B8_SAGOE|nr:Zinc finger protein with KRAB and SCAN domains 1 [Saguinus oedipus]
MVPLDPVQESSSFDLHHEATQSHFRHSSRKPRLLQSRVNMLVQEGRRPETFFEQGSEQS